MRRTGAFLLHLAISAVIFGALVALIVFVWYPDFFFEADGGWQGVRIVMLVDLVAGPLLTLVVYKPGKPNLRMDLTLIALFQTVCLIGGTWVVYSERPLALVYGDGKFFSMTASDFAKANLDPALLGDFPGAWPKRIAVELPNDPLVEGTIRREAIQNNRPVRTLSEYYVPLTPATLHTEREAIAPAALAGLDRESRQLPGWLARHGGKLEDYAFFNFATRYHYAFLGVRRTDGELVGMLRTQGEL